MKLNRITNAPVRPRYVDTFEEENEIGIAAVQKEINSLEGELKVVQTEMNKY